MGAPLHPLRPLLQHLADRCAEGGEATTRALLPPLARVLVDFEPSLAQLPGMARLEEPAPLPPDSAKARVLGVLREVVSRLSQEQPLLLVVDDLQWADGLTREFLGSLDEAFLGSRRIFWLGLYRAEEADEALRAWASASSVLSVRLGRLERESVEVLLGEMLATPRVPSALVERVAEQAQGNPFFVAELLREAVAEGALRRVGGAWEVDEARASRGLSSALRDLLLLRLEGLGAAAREVLGRLAVLGQEAEIPLLEACGVELDALVPLLERRVVEWEEGRAWSLRFARDKLREGAYSAFSHPDRARLHRLTAEGIERCYRGQRELDQRHGELAHHWEQAGDLAQARRCYTQAGEVALARSAHKDACALLYKALALARGGAPASPEEIGRLERWLGEAYTGLRMHAEAARHLSEGVRLMGWPAPAGGFDLALALGREVLEQCARRARSREVALPPQDPRCVEGARAYIALQATTIFTNDAGVMVYSSFKALNLAEAGGAASELAQGLGLAATIVGLVPGLARSVRWYDDASFRALAHAGASSAQVSCRVYRGTLRLYQAQSAEALCVFREATEIA